MTAALGFFFLLAALDVGYGFNLVAAPRRDVTYTTPHHKPAASEARKKTKPSAAVIQLVFFFNYR